MYERTVTLDFQQWLAGVTERIHQTMHYQSDGNINTWLATRFSDIGKSDSV